jgi:hypothetical protein
LRGRIEGGPVDERAKGEVAGETLDGRLLGEECGVDLLTQPRLGILEGIERFLEGLGPAQILGESLQLGNDLLEVSTSAC